MRLPQPLFVVLAVAVFVVSLGAGGAVGYGHAADAATSTQQAGTSGIAATAATGTEGGLSTPTASPAGPASDPTATPTVGPSASGAGPSPAPSPSPTPIATWPLVAADAPGRPFDFAVRVPVLMYHRVAPADQIGLSLPGLVVSPELFAAQLEALVTAGWRSITAAQLAADLAAGVRPPPRTFVITFDDGRSDGYTEAFRSCGDWASWPRST